VTIPIQALTIRRPEDLENASEKGSVQAAAPPKDASKTRKMMSSRACSSSGTEGAVRTGATGVAGTTDIEVLSGLKEGDEIVTGSYKVLRTMKPGRA